MKIQEVKEGGGYFLENKTRLNLPILGYTQTISSSLRIILFSNYSLHKAFLNLHSQDYFLKGVIERKKNNVYSLTITTPFQKINKELIVKNELINSLFLPFSLNFVPLQKKVTFYIFDPFLEKKMKIILENKGKRMLKDFKEEGYLVKIDVEGVEGKIYVDRRGRLLYEEFLGFKFVKENPKDLFQRDISLDTDLIEQFAIKTQYLPERMLISYLKLKIKGVKREWIREDFNQKVFFAQKEAVVEIKKHIPYKIKNLPFSREKFKKYLEENRFIQFNVPLFKSLAKSLVKDEKNPLVILEKFFSWIDKNIKKIPTFSVPNSLDTLKMKRGDCAEISALLVGLLRSVGIPSYVNIGLVYKEGRFFYHAWVSLYVGEWIDTDPALGQLVADATHLKLFRGLESQFEIFKLLNNLKIDILEYR